MIRLRRVLRTALSVVVIGGGIALYLLVDAPRRWVEERIPPRRGAP